MNEHALKFEYVKLLHAYLCNDCYDHEFQRPDRDFATEDMFHANKERSVSETPGFIELLTPGEVYSVRTSMPCWCCLRRRLETKNQVYVVVKHLDRKK